jgi:hypothetical protein
VIGNAEVAVPQIVSLIGAEVLMAVHVPVHVAPCHGRLSAANESVVPPSPAQPDP